MEPWLAIGVTSRRFRRPHRFAKWLVLENPALKTTGTTITTKNVRNNNFPVFRVNRIKRQRNLTGKEISHIIHMAGFRNKKKLLSLSKAAPTENSKLRFWVFCSLNNSPNNFMEVAPPTLLALRYYEIWLKFVLFRPTNRNVGWNQLPINCVCWQYGNLYYIHR